MYVSSYSESVNRNFYYDFRVSLMKCHGSRITRRDDEIGDLLLPIYLIPSFDLAVKLEILGDFIIYSLHHQPYN